MNFRFHSHEPKPYSFFLEYTEPFAKERLAEQLFEQISAVQEKRPIVLVCIGSDRSTGDSLGPLVGISRKRFTQSKRHITVHSSSQSMHVLVGFQVLGMSSFRKDHSHPVLASKRNCLRSVTSTLRLSSTSVDSWR